MDDIKTFWTYVNKYNPEQINAYEPFLTPFAVERYISEQQSIYRSHYGRFSETWNAMIIRPLTYIERHNMLDYHGFLNDLTWPIWRLEAWTNCDETKGHLTHIDSTNSDIRICFYANERDGERGCLTSMRPGRYLARYYGDVLTPKQIEYYAAWQISGIKPAPSFEGEFKLATTATEIVHVYTQGPSSCMAHAASGYNSEPYHPTEVYASGDLAIAYWLSADDKIRARALVSLKEDKAYGRIYPSEGVDVDSARYLFSSESECSDMRDFFAKKLQENGFKSSNLLGREAFKDCRLKTLRNNRGRRVMPYFDSIQASWNGDDIILDPYGDLDCCSTDGLADFDDYEEDERELCDHCESRVDETSSVVVRFTAHGSPSSYESWCDHCIDSDTFYCEGIEEHVSDVIACVEIHQTEHRTAIWSEPYADNHATSCDRSGVLFADDVTTVCMSGSAEGEFWAPWIFEWEGSKSVYGECYPNEDMSERFPGFPAFMDDADISTQARLQYLPSAGALIRLDDMYVIPTPLERLWAPVTPFWRALFQRAA